MPANAAFRTCTLHAALFAAAAMMSGESSGQDRFASQRSRMLDEIAAMASQTGAETRHPRFSDNVMAALGKVPRHRFVPASEERFAYENRPLPIGEGQTISQPYIVALMTELTNPKASDIVLEVGTGSGYQAAILSLLVAKVYTIEIVAPLGRQATRVLRELGYANVETRIGDGYQGWREAAPFDAIMVTAAAADVPQPLIDQLKPGGRLVIPVGTVVQDLMILDKNADGVTVSRRVLPVRFVPLTRAKP
jgi:protein-L-isoaspartate(D-aspartate) O-methyltransferase